MKKIILITALAFCVLFAGCHADAEKLSSSPESKPAAVTERKTVMLYTNMTAGSESPDIKEHTLEYSGELNAKALADGLSKLTGLDFIITASNSEDGLSVDWSVNSTLIANLGGRKQKDEFHFFDADSMRWFMMDSLWLTLTKNLNAENIYYTMDGGKDLSFEELNPVKTFPLDLPYMGSAFFFAHAGGKGDSTDESGNVAVGDGSGTMDELLKNMTDEELKNYIENRLENQRNIREDLGPYTLDEAMKLIQNVMDSRGEKAPKLVSAGDGTINGEHAFIIKAGEDSADGKKFTALYHYAVADSGRVYFIDSAKGTDWILLEAGAEDERR